MIKLLSEIVVDTAKTGIEQLLKGQKKVEKVTNKKLDEKAKKVNAYRKEATKLVSKANKRLKRLEKNNMLDNPAYKAIANSGEIRFSVKGKDYNQLQAEVARLNTFLNARTSTVKGTQSYLKEMAKNTGVSYKNLADLQSKASKFFELASKIEQYLRLTEDNASAIGYQKIWEAVNTYVEAERVDLNNAKLSIDDMVKAVSDAIVEYDKPVKVDYSPMGFNQSEWFTLPKD